MKSAHGFTLFLIFTLFLFNVIDDRGATSIAQANGSSSLMAANAISEVMVPVVEERMVLMVNETRRKLGSFRICAVCTCCGGAKGICLPSPCCYAINCNIPNRPFGFCSFTPKTCNCFGCHL